LLTAGIAVVLPALVTGGAPASTILALLAVAGGSLATWAALRRRPLSAAARQLNGTWVAFLAVVSLVLVLFGPDGHPPETYLLLASALVCSLASIPSVVIRVPLQLAPAVALALALVAGERPLADVIVPAALVLVVAVLTNLLAGELMAARRSEIVARADAERRTELLEAVQDLPGTSADEAVVATVRTLRTLAFEEGRVLVLRAGQLREMAGTDAPARTIARGEAIEWRAIEDDRTIVVPAGDGSANGQLRSASGEVRSAVATPIRVAGQPAGVVVGGRHRPGGISPAEVEVAEVLAAHLGVLLDTQAQVRRQAELLERMAELDLMRSGFAREVSTELRDPLTVVRTVGAALSRHGDHVDPDRRRALLNQMSGQADDLRRTIDALLDFSRFQADRHEAKLVPTALVDLLTPVLRAAGAAVRPEPSELRELGHTVEVDVVLVRHALEILLVTGLTDVDEQVATLHLDDRDEAEIHVVVERHDGTIPSTLVRSLVSQLLVAGGAALDDGAAATVILRRVPAAVEVSP
jgi:K+-sensing histidine kinase KdpD